MSFWAAIQQILRKLSEKRFKILMLEGGKRGKGEKCEVLRKHRDSKEWVEKKY